MRFMLHGEKQSLLTTVFLILECREQQRGTKCRAFNDDIDSIINEKPKDLIWRRSLYCEEETSMRVFRLPP